MTMNLLTMQHFLNIIIIIIVLVIITVVVGESPRVCNGGRPKHIHIAPGHDASTGVIVSFATNWSVPGGPVPDVGWVLYGTSPNDMKSVVGEQEYPLEHNSSIPYTEEKRYYYSPYQHHFEITGLHPATTYYYRVGTMDRKEYENYGGEEEVKEQIEEESFAEEFQEDEEEESSEDEGYVRRMLQYVFAEEFQTEEESSEDEGYVRRMLQYVREDNGCPKANQIYSFRTAPAATTKEDSDTSSVKFAVFGDLGPYRTSIETISHLKEHIDEYNSAFLVGDVAYTEHVIPRWDTFFDILDDHGPFANLTLAIAAGNHDIEKQKNDGKIFEAYETRFRMPRVKPPKLDEYDGPTGYHLGAYSYPLPYEWGNSYYSFVIGPSMNIVLNSYSSMEPGSTQYEWFHDTLRSVDRNNTPWVLVMLHVPIYNGFTLHRHDPPVTAAREHIEPLLIQYFVNVVFTGHVHAYQRTHNVAKQKRSRRGPVHILIGTAGDSWGPFETAEGDDWLAARDGTYYGYGSFEIYNRTHAHWKWVPLDKLKEHNYVEDDPDVPILSLEADEVVLENQFYME